MRRWSVSWGLFDHATLRSTARRRLFFTERGAERWIESKRVRPEDRWRPRLFAHPGAGPMTAPHVGGRAGSGREGLAVWLRDWVLKHGGTDLRDTGRHLVLECLCGAPLGPQYGPLDGGSNEVEVLAYFAHQADALLAAGWIVDGEEA